MCFLICCVLWFDSIKFWINVQQKQLLKFYILFTCNRDYCSTHTFWVCFFCLYLFWSRHPILQDQRHDFEVGICICVDKVSNCSILFAFLLAEHNDCSNYDFKLKRKSPTYLYSTSTPRTIVNNVLLLLSFFSLFWFSNFLRHSSTKSRFTT